MTQTLPSVGDIAPDFTLPQDGGDPINLLDLAGGPVVLFFYPKDNTPGCTTEALDFTALWHEFQSLGVQVLGVSKDSLKKHENFRNKHALAVPLLSDAESDVCERYGTWGEKKNYGRTYMGITRTTFLIGADGHIAQVWEKVKVKGHAQEVLEVAHELAKTT
ncbi:peroxiredoxin Q/BCP [Aliiroseovarius halocynthiae]|uniref:thioredoxin-dependent peroxiredoxin n=1 Tax=Aliiroseovarius halocynthiae TaxID=985055 RepID=A0A545SWM5_9RHOB|nr:thioredoxin-dependent thiol peroxidase [Aliiroseovarius halocynthiae]TQV69356.1 thioredoxin-dependent thiol peroxidase [Aliiroseovarius halocynthiae]SMR72457.1 peroxiredoxin Q/BCP [Aliiroseovarius halocynthiae]